VNIYQATLCQIQINGNIPCHGRDILETLSKSVNVKRLSLYIVCSPTNRNSRLIIVISLHSIFTDGLTYVEEIFLFTFGRHALSFVHLRSRVLESKVLHFSLHCSF
jgi:uncharacterized membrane protein YhhN